MIVGDGRIGTVRKTLVHEDTLGVGDGEPSDTCKEVGVRGTGVIVAQAIIFGISQLAKVATVSVCDLDVFFPSLGVVLVEVERQ